MRNVVETIYGRYNKYEVVKVPGGLFTSTSFVIYRDGEYYKGSYSDLRAAVEDARRSG